MTDGLKVLLTNAGLDRRSGAETVIRDVSLGLLRRGHRPVVYSPHLGAPAQEIHARGVAVIDDLARMAEPPDVIHGQHFIQTGEALLRFPRTPAIQMCHAWTYWQERPAKFPQVHRYVAVDETVRDRLVHTDGLPPERVEVILNAVDMSRIPARPEPLPPRPRRALAFTKYRGQIPLIEAACAQRGIALEVLGLGGERISAHPERELVGYDLVFATARMALEALSAGCAVVVCDARGVAGLVTRETLPRLRPLNFGLRSLVHPVTVARLGAEIDRYDAADAAAVAERVRLMAPLEPALDRLLQLYGDAIAQPPPDEADVAAAAQAFLSQALPRRRNDTKWPWMAERDELLARIDQLDRDLAEARRAALDRAP